MRNKKSPNLGQYQVPIKDPTEYDDISITDLHLHIQSAFQKLDECISKQTRFSHKNYLVEIDLRDRIRQLEENNSQLKEYAIDCQFDLTQLSSKFLYFFKKYTLWKTNHDQMKIENEKIVSLLKIEKMKTPKQNFLVSNESNTGLEQQSDINIYSELQDLLKSTNKNTLPLALNNCLHSLLKKNIYNKSMSTLELVRAFTTLFNQHNNSRLLNNQILILSKKQSMQQRTIKDSKNQISANDIDILSNNCLSFTEKVDSSTNQQLPLLLENMKTNYFSEPPQIKESILIQISKEKTIHNTELQELINLINESKLFNLSSSKHSPIHKEVEPSQIIKYSLKDKLQQMADSLVANKVYPSTDIIGNLNKKKFFTHTTEQSDSDLSPIKEQLSHFLQPYMRKLLPKKESSNGLYSNAIKIRGHRHRSISFNDK